MFWLAGEVAPSPLVGVVTVLSAVGLGCGMWAVLIPSKRHRSMRRTSSVLERIAHSLRDVSPAARLELNPPHTDPASVTLDVFSPTFEQLATWFHRVSGGQQGELIDRAGWSGRHTEYRYLRFLSALGGGVIVAVVLVAASALGVRMSVGVGAVLLGLGPIVGVGVFDRWVRRLARLKQERLSEEFPTIIELLALALSAGDSLFGALRRISHRGRGELASQWAAVVRRVELGEPLGPTLTHSARTMGVEEIEALVDHLVHALDRGAPVAEVVRAHSSDSRLRRLRAVVDRAGKAEVVMLVPLVMLILPITVIFAVWPSLQALQWNAF